MEHRKLLCRQVQEYIDGLSQRQLSEEIKNAPMYEHIQQCLICRQYLNRAKSLSEQLDQWSVPALKRNITAGVMAQIAQLERDRKIEHFSLWGRLPALFVHRLKVPVGVAAAVFVILAISLTLNITRLNTYLDSKENMQAKTDQTIRQRPVAIQPKVIQIQSGSKEGIYFFGANPEAAPTPLVIILGVPGVIPIEPTVQPVTVNLSNQSL